MHSVWSNSHVLQRKRTMSPILTPAARVGRCELKNLIATLSDERQRAPGRQARVDRSMTQFYDVIVRFDRGDTASPLNVTVS
jgi:hypothetical protein